MSCYDPAHCFSNSKKYMELLAAYFDSDIQSKALLMKVPQSTILPNVSDWDKDRMGNEWPKQSDNYNSAVFVIVVVFAKAHGCEAKIEKGPTFVRKKLFLIILETAQAPELSLDRFERIQSKELRDRWIEKGWNHCQYMDLLKTRQAHKEFQDIQCWLECVR